MWCCTRDYESDVRLDGKTVVITGGNNGIGKETSKDLYKRGARILICSRNQKKSIQVIQEIKKEVEQINTFHDIKPKHLDLSDLSSVRKCAKEILEEENEINYLINNAGVMGHPQQLSADGFEMHFAANYLGHFLFTLLLLPRIICSGPSRIINVSSVGHKVFWLSRRLDLAEVKKVKRWILQLEGYCQSKCAQVIFTKELAKRLKDAGVENVTTYSLHPGVIATDLFQNWNLFVWGLAWLWGRFLVKLFFLTPEQGCRTTIYCALEKELENQSGLYYSNCSQDSVNRLVNNTNLAKELWEKSLEFTNLRNYDPFKPEENE